VRTVRAVAILYYTANEPWTPGDGGETGLYRRRTDPPDRPAARVAPHNNSMVAFECTPNSFHSFVTNRAKPRRSVTMWLHRRDTDVVDRWGEESIVAWPGAGVVPVPTAGVATTGAATP
jgi:Rps23 Pro-64 3,4-dihydroxylase Tpa1-like proline 4-hydroxylase